MRRAFLKSVDVFLCLLSSLVSRSHFVLSVRYFVVPDENDMISFRSRGIRNAANYECEIFALVPSESCLFSIVFVPESMRGVCAYCWVVDAC